MCLSTLGEEVNNKHMKSILKRIFNALAVDLRLLRRRSLGYVYSKDLLRKWAAEAVRASGGVDFYYDARFRRVMAGPDKLAQALDSVSGALYVYPVIEAGVTQAVVFVTDSAIDWTTGYLVCMGPEVPKAHRPGPFDKLEPLDDKVYRFESR